MPASQRFEMESRRYINIEFEKVFSALEKLYEQEGYKKPRSDPKKGTIVGVEEAKHVRGTLGDIKKAPLPETKLGSDYEFASSVTRIDDKTIEVRLTVFRLDHYLITGTEGIEISDPILYQGLFKKLKKIIDKEEEPESEAKETPPESLVPVAPTRTED
jgi:hypothetical protein